MKTIFPMLTDDIRKLPLYVNGIGLQESQEYTFREIGFHCYHLLLCEKGSGKLVIENKEYIISEGTAFYFYPNIPHEYYAIVEPWTTKWIVFDGHYIPNILQVLQINHIEIFNFSDTPEINILIDEIYLYLESRKANKLIETSALLYKLLIKINNSINFDNPENKANKYVKLEPAITFIEKNYSSDISLEDIARNINVTSSYLCRLFKQTYNMSPVKYILRYRVYKAKEFLIKYPNKNIKEISYNVGFNDTSYFCSVFKEHEGYSPTQFRKLHSFG